MRFIQKLLCQRRLAFSLFIFCSFLLVDIAQAETTDARPYKISIIIFKHFPMGKSTPAPLTARWSEKTFEDSTFITNPSLDASNPYLNSNSDILLPERQSDLASSYRILSHDPNYAIIYNGAWVSYLQSELPRKFHFQQSLEDKGDILDGLLQITLKFYLDVHFQTQWLTPSSTSFYNIDALDETYQAPNNQLEYIDGPIYSALILIKHYDGN